MRLAVVCFVCTTKVLKRFCLLLLVAQSVAGDLAQFLVANDLTGDEAIQKAETLSFPKSVVEYFQVSMGTQNASEISGVFCCATLTFLRLSLH